MRRWLLLLSWFAVACSLSGALAWSLRGGRRALFMPGTTSDGHYQIVQACEGCHTPLEGVTQDVCLGCHRAELDAAADSHPPAKFLDPRNAPLIAKLDARRCVTCHGEHRPARTDRFGVTVESGFCRACHADIARERPSHDGLAFTTCRDAGCHNFHDNRALSQEFIAARRGQPVLRNAPRRLAVAVAVELPWRRLVAAAADAPTRELDYAAVAAWAGSAHAAVGLNCSGCHGQAAAWDADPGGAVCVGCHDAQAARFGRGRHGMRPAAGMPPMTVAEARLPMARGDRTLGCASCHDAHGVDKRRAAAAACLGCHADEHSRAYVASPHAALWFAEAAGLAAPGVGVSCATCHMPGLDGVTDHDQSATMRPVSHMLDSCLACHGYEYAIDALADPTVVRSNFSGAPTRHVRTSDMVELNQRRQR